MSYLDDVNDKDAGKFGETWEEKSAGCARSGSVESPPRHASLLARLPDCAYLPFRARVLIGRRLRAAGTKTLLRVPWGPGSSIREGGIGSTGGTYVRSAAR